ADKIIFPYEPKQIVIYCGENDLAASDTVTADMVVSRFDTLFNLIRNRLPNISIVFVSLKPSPSRQKFWPKMEEANEAIKAMLENENNAVFVDVYHLMFNEDGSIKKEIFLSDNLHMNAKGYAIWQSAIAPYLLN
ncbi:MAG: G-D-S-L family lipolytic protein, partial [Bacteroidetes bacterium]|nr:G-D-S-L family lipolytic protein [Bacteroidota bacterium]